ncbi:MAG: endonuclease/exonuclease/phosphatase family protein [Chloroflexota bacterium]
MGDFNSSPWSVYFQEFVWETGLRNGRLGYGIAPTWPAPRFALNQFPHLAPALTPLDHILYSPDMTLNSFEVGPYVGSDHYPLIVKLSPANKP